MNICKYIYKYHIYLFILHSEMMRCSQFEVVCQEKKIIFVGIRALTSTHAVTMVSRENSGVVKDVRKASGCNSIIDETAETNF